MVAEFKLEINFIVTICNEYILSHEQRAIFLFRNTLYTCKGIHKGKIKENNHGKSINFNARKISR